MPAAHHTDHSDQSFRPPFINGSEPVTNTGSKSETPIIMIRQRPVGCPRPADIFTALCFYESQEIAWLHRHTR
jgi:hypothetical protein